MRSCALIGITQMSRGDVGHMVSVSGENWLCHWWHVCIPSQLHSTSNMHGPHFLWHICDYNPSLNCCTTAILYAIPWDFLKVPPRGLDLVIQPWSHCTKEMCLNILLDTLCFHSLHLFTLFSTPKQERHGNTDEHPVKEKIDGHNVVERMHGLAFYHVKNNA